jgi:hypothetical protein
MDDPAPLPSIPIAEGLGPVIFGAAVRMTGLLLVLNGLKWIYFGFIEIVVSKHVNSIDYVVSAFGYVVAGVVLLRGTAYFVAFAYPQPAQEHEASHEAE